jgi:hypothetical protein
MKTMDELPEKFTHDDIRAANAKHWDQRHAFRDQFGTVAPTQEPIVSKSGNTPSPVPSQPGGEKFSKKELADYSNREDRNYRGAGRATMPEDIVNESGNLPRKVSANSWETSGGGGGAEPHPTGVTEWSGGMEPKKP